MQTLPEPAQLCLGRLTHLDAYAYPSGVVTASVEDLLPWLVTEEQASCYRYTLARRDLHLRVIGLVLAWRDASTPCRLSVEGVSIAELAFEQGRPLGNVQDATGTLHRLEAYDGLAQSELLLSVVRDALPRAQVIPLAWPSAPRTPAQPVWITSDHDADVTLQPAPWMLHRIDPTED